MSESLHNGALHMEDGSLYQGEYECRKGPDGSDQLVAHGQGRFLSSAGDLFEGKYRDGKRLHGRIVFHVGSVYEGNFNEDEVPHGDGSLTLPDGRIYRGLFANNRIHGKGSFKNFLAGCNHVSFAGVSIDGEFFSESRHQSETAIPLF